MCSNSGTALVDSAKTVMTHIVGRRDIQSLAKVLASSGTLVFRNSIESTYR